MSSQSNISADPAVATTPSGALTTGTTSLTSTRASSTASADGPGSHNSLPQDAAAADGVPPEEVNDKVCPDTVYGSVDSGDGKTAF
jgi:hypothetical protein